jgi:cytochrome c biogenesis protein CcmG/thiol:disulfide interchange protein DsbE
MNRTVLLIGIAITAVVVAVLFLALGKDPQHLDSQLIGRPAPLFALKQAGVDATTDLSQLRGKPVVINFWATWCVPCYQEHPVLVEAARAMSPQVQFIGVVFNDKEPNILQFLRENGQSYPTLLDDEGKTAIAYGVGGVPETFFVSPNGTVVEKFEGPLSPERLQQLVAKAAAGDRGRAGLGSLPITARPGSARQTAGLEPGPQATTTTAGPAL